MTLTQLYGQLTFHPEVIRLNFEGPGSRLQWHFDKCEYNHFKRGHNPALAAGFALSEWPSSFELHWGRDLREAQFWKAWLLTTLAELWRFMRNKPIILGLLNWKKWWNVAISWTLFNLKVFCLTCWLTPPTGVGGVIVFACVCLSQGWGQVLFLKYKYKSKYFWSSTSPSTSTHLKLWVRYQVF